MNLKTIGTSSDDERLSIRLSRVFGDSSHNQGHTAGVTGVGPQLSAALEVYLSLKGAGRPKTFEAGARRAVGYLLEVTDDKPIDAYVRADANALREYLRGRGLSSESIGRNLTSIRAIVNFVSKEEGSTAAFSLQWCVPW